MAVQGFPGGPIGQSASEVQRRPSAQTLEHAAARARAAGAVVVGQAGGAGRAVPAVGRALPGGARRLAVGGLRARRAGRAGGARGRAAGRAAGRADAVAAGAAGALAVDQAAVAQHRRRRGRARRERLDELPRSSRARTPCPRRSRRRWCTRRRPAARCRRRTAWPRPCAGGTWRPRTGSPVSQVAPAGRASSPSGGEPEQSDAFDAWICASSALPGAGLADRDAQRLEVAGRHQVIAERRPGAAGDRLRVGEAPPSKSMVQLHGGRVVDVGEQIEVDAREVVAGERQRLRDLRSDRRPGSTP